MNQALSSVTSSALNLIPTSVKDAAGLSKQILEEVQHITTLSLENVAWLTERRLYLILGYVDGFQIWDVQDPSGGRELVSARLDKAVTVIQLLPRADSAAPPLSPNPREGPTVAYVHKAAPREVHMYNVVTSQEPHLIRVTKPALTLHATPRILAISMQDQVDLHDIRTYQPLFSVQTSPCSIRPTFALGPRWAAYKIPNTQTSSLSHLNQLGGAQAPKDVIESTTHALQEGMSYIGSLSQQALDSLLMPPTDAREVSIVAVRDVSSRQVLCQFAPHKEEPIEFMTWDPSGLLLVSITQMGHTVLVHRAAATPSPRTQSERAEKPEKDDTTQVSFDHVFTLNRGFTPAIISDICLSEDSQMIAVCSAKGTIHVYTLPIDVRKRISRKQSAALPQAQVLSAVTRIKLGSILLQEGLLPCAAFDGSKGTSNVRTLAAATKAGMLSLFSLRILRHEGEGKSECFLNVNKNLRAFRPRGSFIEKALDRSMPSPPSWTRPHSPLPEDSPTAAASSEDDARRWLAKVELPEVDGVPIWFLPSMSFYALTSCNDNVSLRTGDLKQTRSLSTPLHFRQGQMPEGHVTNETDMQLYVSETSCTPLEDAARGNSGTDEYFLIDKPEEVYM